MGLMRRNSLGIRSDHECRQRAQQVVGPGEKILGVYSISASQLRNYMNQNWSIVACPLFWGFLCVLMPCFCACMGCTKSKVESTLWIVSDQKIYRQQDWEAPGCGGPQG